MHLPRSLEFLDFDSGGGFLKILHPLVADSLQARYLKTYLNHLDAEVILVEPNYFDRDYLSEFSVFYSKSAIGYPNICQRLHFFREQKITKDVFSKAIGGDSEALKTLNKNYLGFSVIRPIEEKPFGKTVLCWFKKDTNYRVTQKRSYICHVAGIELEVTGLAWQQQDTGVSACATIALWSALNSSAFDEYHTIPTTSEITEIANKVIPTGTRAFPSEGLTKEQLCEVIKNLELAPVVQDGDLLSKNRRYFSKRYFTSSIAWHIRSGYPVIVIGILKNSGLHAVCVTGFREPETSSLTQTDSQSKGPQLQDSKSKVIYLHDDNIGPNVRCEIIEDPKNGCVYFKPVAPNYGGDTKHEDVTSKYPEFIPLHLVIATHDDLRIPPERFMEEGLEITKIITGRNQDIFLGSPEDVSFSVQLKKRVTYVGEELERLLKSNPKLLASVRMGMCKNLSPMSFHIGIIRVGFKNSPVLDIIYDTTSTASSLRRLASIAFQPIGLHYFKKYANLKIDPLIPGLDTTTSQKKTT